MAQESATDRLKGQIIQRQKATDEVVLEGELAALPATRTEANLVQMQSTLKNMLPATMSPEKAVKLVNNTIQLLRKTPRLAECGDTIMGGVLTCSQLGLELGVDALGEAYLLPMRNYKTKRTEATLIIGYKGYRKLAWQSGVIMSISREIVYKEDVFNMTRGTKPEIIHIASDEERKNVRGYYAVVFLTNGGNIPKYMSLREAQQHRDAYAMAKNSNGVVGPWKDNFNEMALKTVLLKALRDSPQSIEDKLGIAAKVDGSVRYDVTEVQDAGQLLNVAELGNAFDQISASTQPPPEEERAAPAGAGTKRLDPEKRAQHQPQQNAPAPQDPHDMTPEQYRADMIQRIYQMCEAQGEEDVMLMAESITTVSHTSLDEYTSHELNNIVTSLATGTVPQG